MGGINTSRISQSTINIPQNPGIPQVVLGSRLPGVISQAGEDTSTGGLEIPGGIYEMEKGETDWDEVYRQYKILNPDETEKELDPPGDALPVEYGIVVPHSTDEEETEMAIDWGDIFTTSIPDIVGMAGQKFLGPEPQSYSGAPIAGTPAKVTMDTRTGKITPCRRRRRRRLLTPTDLSDLAALQAIVGKGDALKLAVAKAVRR